MIELCWYSEVGYFFLIVLQFTYQVLFKKPRPAKLAIL